ncbi:potassium channel family protein [Nocardia alni]|uniref:potassium channel family protein n=1 Tax=Nocardia alni TaxID=2815723 RepID=UPI001C2404D6|nr:potassium channel family protein [Nocardia alni]
MRESSEAAAGDGVPGGDRGASPDADQVNEDEGGGRSGAARRVKVALAVLIPVHVAFWGYYWAGSDRSGPAAPSVLLACVPPTVITICAVAAVLALRDRLWTVIVIMIAGLDILVTFAKLYYDAGTTEHFTEPLSHVGALFFALGMLTTAGTGNISPISDPARIIVGIQMVLDLLYFGVALVIAVTRFTESAPARSPRIRS